MKDQDNHNLLEYVIYAILAMIIVLFFLLKV